MIRVYVTQRVSVVKIYEERRDCIDQRWIEFLLSIGIFPILLPNNIDYVKRLLLEENIGGMIFTGGNNLISQGGDAPERDEVEKFLLRWAIRNECPVLGVCRGMQLIQEYFDNTLEHTPGHVATKMRIIVNQDSKIGEFLKRDEGNQEINSYHNFGSYSATGELLEVARSKDGVIKSIECRNYDIFGIMWHSERERMFHKEDERLFKKIFIKDVKK